MQSLRSRFPQSQILSTSTPRGEEIAQKKGQADKVIYLPLDISYLVRRSLDRMRPDIVVIFETEIWPNLFWECASKNIPVVLVSGRISPRSFPLYKMAKAFFASVLAQGYFLMQSKEDMERILAIGVPTDRVSLCGDIKRDGIRTALSPEEIAFIEKTFPGQRPIVVAGSTHAGEEAMLLDIYTALRQEWPSLSLILAPRHLKRMGEIQHLLEQRKIKYTLRSQILQENINSVIVLDTYGELSKVYYLADVVFVGGTWANVGGHNLLEPAALQKAVLFGPHIFNCKDQAQLLVEKKAGFLVSSPDELKEKMRELLSSQEKASAMGKRGQGAILENQGAIAKCIAKIEQILGI
jgi:3-deoxy-D-manno-octulosonic-acid transferase